MFGAHIDRFQALLSDQLVELIDRLAGMDNLQEAFAPIQRGLSSLHHIDSISIAAQMEASGKMEAYALRGTPCISLTDGTFSAASPCDHAWTTQKPALTGHLCAMPLSTSRKRLGVLAFLSKRPAPIDPSAMDQWIQVSKAVALGIEMRLVRNGAAGRAEAIMSIARACLASLDLRDLFLRISASLRVLIRHEYAGLTIYEAEKNQLRLRILDFPKSKGHIHENLIMPAKRSLSGTVFLSGQTLVLRFITDRELTCEVASVLTAEGLKSVCFVPLACERGPLGTLNFGSTVPDAFSDEHIELIHDVSTMIGNAVSRMIAVTTRQISPVRRPAQMREPRVDPPNESALRDLIGGSPPFQQFMDAVKTVATTDATVIVLGETGTGKELVARAIHDLSPRRDRNFVTINCTAIPAALLESELFGHERGAFTGAIAPRVGRFEMAHGGTLFLDEIGDMPLELQSKLLRVLQHQTFERLGSSQTVRVDVRFVAATNRDLPQQVRQGAFRSDLFYRLNVFPVCVPPLRARIADIEALACHFVRLYAERFGRDLQRIAPATLERLRNWHWPGNVRELEHLIERAVILSSGPQLEIPSNELVAEAPETCGNRIKDAESELIRRSLRQADGVIGGAKGAAALLGLKRSTLQSKMKKLGISAP